MSRTVDIYKDIMTRLGRTVLFYRQERGFTQKSLCQLSGLKSNSSISDIESGNYAPSWLTLAAFCEAFDISVTEFFETFNDMQ